jgi:hypothetical protein
MAGNQDPGIPDHDQNLHQPSQFILPKKPPLQNPIQKDDLDKLQNLRAEQGRQDPSRKGAEVPLPSPIEKEPQGEAHKKDDRPRHEEDYKKGMMGHWMDSPLEGRFEIIKAQGEVYSPQNKYFSSVLFSPIFFFIILTLMSNDLHENIAKRQIAS